MELLIYRSTTWCYLILLRIQRLNIKPLNPKPLKGAPTTRCYHYCEISTITILIVLIIITLPLNYYDSFSFSIIIITAVCYYSHHHRVRAHTNCFGYSEKSWYTRQFAHFLIFDMPKTSGHAVFLSFPRTEHPCANYDNVQIRLHPNPKGQDCCNSHDFLASTWPHVYPKKHRVFVSSRKRALRARTR